MKKYIISALAAAGIMSSMMTGASAANCISVNGGQACVSTQNGGVAILASFDCGKLENILTKYLAAGEQALFNVCEQDKIMLWQCLYGGNCSPETIPVIVTEDDMATPSPEVTAEVTAEPTQKPTAVPTQRPTAVPTQKPTAVPTQRPTAVPTQKPTAAPSQNTSSLSAMEQEVFRLVNQERAKNGLNSLSWAEDLAVVARAHSSDMIARNFFDHTNPDGKSPFDRLRANGISYRAAAENIAAGQSSAESVMNSWMNSSGHRANILNSSLKEIGVGAVKSSSGRIYWTQLFVAR